MLPSTVRDLLMVGEQHRLRVVSPPHRRAIAEQCRPETYPLHKQGSA
jgi:hypothetical protein